MILNITLWVLTLWGMVLAILIHVRAPHDNYQKIFAGAIGAINLVVAFIIQPVLDHYWWMLAKSKGHAGYQRQFGVCAFVVWANIAGLIFLGISKQLDLHHPDRELQMKCFIGLYCAFALIAWRDRRDFRRKFATSTS